VQATLVLSGNDFVLGTSDDQFAAARMHDKAVNRLNEKFIADNSDVRVREDLSFREDNDNGDNRNCLINYSQEPHIKPSVYGSKAKDVAVENTRFTELICSIDEQIPANHSFSIHEWSVNFLKWRYKEKKKAEEEAKKKEERKEKEKEEGPMGI